MSKSAQTQVQAKQAPQPKVTSTSSKLLQHRSNNEAESNKVPPIVHEVLNSPGKPLDETSRKLMEPRFGFDFSRVRVHNNKKAGESAKSVNALAYTVGQNIVFDSGRFAPWNLSGQRLLAHELTHVVQQRNISAKSLQRLNIDRRQKNFYENQAEYIASKIVQGQKVSANSIFQINTPQIQLQNEEEQTSIVKSSANRLALNDISQEYLESDWNKLNRLGIVRVAETGAKGANLRRDASTSKEPIHWLEENTKVFIIAENTAWTFVNVLNKKHKGAFGYIYKSLIWQNIPDPDAVLYYTENQGEGLQKIVENHPQYKDYDIRTGDDVRSLIMAVYLANEQDQRTHGNVYINEEKLKQAQDPGFLEQTKDQLDEYRRALRPILQSIEIQQGEKIWLPGKSYVESLKGTGIIPTRPEWKNVAIDITKGVGGFTLGLVDGLISSIVDVFVGIYDMVESVISTVIDIISGKAIEAAKELYNLIDEMSAEELLTQLKNAISGLASEIFNDFVTRWDANNTYKKWYFRGKVVGYILAEILMLIFSGGAANAFKWLGKLGKIGSKLAKVLGKALNKIEKLADFPKLSKNKLSKSDVVEAPSEGSKEAKEFPLALGLAKSITELHDRKDSPISVLETSLLPLKKKFNWIKRFDTPLKSPGHYKVFMIGTKYTVDEDYTIEEEKNLESFEFRKRIESAVIEEMKDRPGGETAESWELKSLSKAHEMSKDNKDHNLGPNQKRYQAKFWDDFNREYVDISVNYDVDNGTFGIIKFAGGK